MTPCSVSKPAPHSFPRLCLCGFSCAGSVLFRPRRGPAAPRASQCNERCLSAGQGAAAAQRRCRRAPGQGRAVGSSRCRGCSCSVWSRACAALPHPPRHPDPPGEIQPYITACLQDPLLLSVTICPLSVSVPHPAVWGQAEGGRSPRLVPRAPREGCRGPAGAGLDSHPAMHLSTVGDAGAMHKAETPAASQTHLGLKGEWDPSSPSPVF